MRVFPSDNRDDFGNKKGSFFSFSSRIHSEREELEAPLGAPRLQLIWLPRWLAFFYFLCCLGLSFLMCVLAADYFGVSRDSTAVHYKHMTMTHSGKNVGINRSAPEKTLEVSETSGENPIVRISSRPNTDEDGQLTYIDDGTSQRLEFGSYFGDSFLESGTVVADSILGSVFIDASTMVVGSSGSAALELNSYASGDVLLAAGGGRIQLHGDVYFQQSMLLQPSQGISQEGGIRFDGSDYEAYTLDRGWVSLTGAIKLNQTRGTAFQVPYFVSNTSMTGSDGLVWNAMDSAVQLVPPVDSDTIATVLRWFAPYGGYQGGFQAGTNYDGDLSFSPFEGSAESSISGVEDAMTVSTVPLLSLRREPMLVDVPMGRTGSSAATGFVILGGIDSDGSGGAPVLSVDAQAGFSIVSPAGMQLRTPGVELICSEGLNGGYMVNFTTVEGEEYDAYLEITIFPPGYLLPPSIGTVVSLVPHNATDDSILRGVVAGAVDGHYTTLSVRLFADRNVSRSDLEALLPASGIRKIYFSTPSTYLLTVRDESETGSEYNATHSSGLSMDSKESRVWGGSAVAVGVEGDTLVDFAMNSTVLRHGALILQDGVIDAPGAMHLSAAAALTVTSGSQASVVSGGDVAVTSGGSAAFNIASSLFLDVGESADIGVGGDAHVSCGGGMAVSVLNDITFDSVSGAMDVSVGEGQRFRVAVGDDVGLTVYRDSIVLNTAEFVYRDGTGGNATDAGLRVLSASTNGFTLHEGILDIEPGIIQSAADVFDMSAESDNAVLRVRAEGSQGHVEISAAEAVVLQYMRDARLSALASSVVVDYGTLEVMWGDITAPVAPLDLLAEGGDVTVHSSPGLVSVTSGLDILQVGDNDDFYIRRASRSSSGTGGTMELIGQDGVGGRGGTVAVETGDGTDAG
eukprot:Rmarinus@m.5764